MQGPKKTLSIFNFSKPQQRFLKFALVFFMPVVIACCVLELMAAEIPISYKIISEYFNKHSNEIELMALGSSQVKTGFNPALSNKNAITFASASQHHKEDFHILKGTRNRAPNLKYVLLEISYNHLELPYHSTDYWKNSIYLKYYNVNAFERPTYFKDRLLYLSNPRYFSHFILEHYIYGTDKTVLNKYGYKTNNYHGAFEDLGYDKAKIAAHKFKMLNHEDAQIFKKNTTFLYKMLDYAKAENLMVIVCTFPVYKTYLKKRKPAIVRRRDSILAEIKMKYTNVIVLDAETDTIHFNERDFINENHLNPDGAKKFTEMVNRAIDSSN